MKKAIGITLVLLTALVSLGAQTLLDKPVATVNLVKPEMVSQRQLNRQFAQVEAIRLQGGQNAPPVNKMQVLELMISEILVNQGMERDAVTVSQQEIDETIAQQKAAVEQQNNVALTDLQFRNAIEQQMKIAWDSYVDQITLQLKQQKYLLQEKADVLAKGETPPSYQDIDSFYRKNRSQFTNPDVIRFSHIFVSTENLSGGEKQQALGRAEEAYRKLQNGTAFDALVVEYSDDNRSRYKGGCGIPRHQRFQARSGLRHGVCGHPFFYDPRRNIPGAHLPEGVSHCQTHRVP